MNCRSVADAWVGIALASATCLMGCSSSAASSDATSDAWNEASHGNVAADTGKAFPDTVRSVTITLAQTDWSAIKSAVAAVCGNMGSSTCSDDDSLDASGAVTAWHSATLHADGEDWGNVGIRLKSNKSLAVAWSGKNFRFHWRLKIDKYDSAQRFYGFKKLELSNLYGDTSYIRDRVAGELMRESGIPAPHSGFVHLYLALGSDTTVDAGIYGLQEVVDKPLLKRTFGSSGGNLYEPSSNFASYAVSDFESDDADGSYTDVKAMYDALQASTRTTAPSIWRSGLAATFDVAGFLRWLAASAILQGPDVYGAKADNYFLYYDKGDKKTLAWLPGDLHTYFTSTSKTSTSVWYPSASDAKWPLITYLLKDTTYCREYLSDLKEMVGSTGALNAANFSAKVTKYGNLVSSSSSTTSTAVSTLSSFLTARLLQVDTASTNCP